MNRALIIALAIFVSLSGILAYYSVKVNRDLAKAEERLEVAVAANTSLIESLQRKESSCEINDRTTTEFFTEREGVAQTGQKDVDVINSLPRKPVVAPTPAPQTSNEVSQNDTNQVVDIDGSLPPSLVGLLQSSCTAAKGSTCSAPQ